MPIQKKLFRILITPGAAWCMLLGAYEAMAGNLRDFYQIGQFISDSMTEKYLASNTETMQGTPSDPSAIERHISQETSVRLKKIPDEAEIIFDMGEYIYVMDRNGENVTQITFENPRDWRHVALFYDRRYVVGNTHEKSARADYLSKLWIFDLEKGTEARLVPEFEKAGVGGVSIGPKGFVYFAGRESDKLSVPMALYRVKYDGTGVQQLTEVNAADVAVSEDGQYVAFLHFVQGGLPGTDEPNHTEAWIVGSDGSNPHPVFTKGGAMGFGSLHDPELSPDNRRVTFSMVNRDFKNWPDNELMNTAHDIWVVNTDGSNLTRVTQPGPISIIPSWKDDWIVFVELNQKDNYRGASIIKSDGTGYGRIKEGASTPKWIPPRD